MLKNKGFTLVEVLIAVAILSMGLLMTVTLIVSSLKLAQEAQETTEITLLVSSLGSLVKTQDPANLSVEEFQGITYNNQPVEITLAPVAANEKLTRVTITLVTKNGKKRTFVIYATKR